MFEEECTLCDSENGEYNDGMNTCEDCGGNRFCDKHIDICDSCEKKFCDTHIYSTDDWNIYKCSECIKKEEE